MEERGEDGEERDGSSLNRNRTGIAYEPNTTMGWESLGMRTRFLQRDRSETSGYMVHEVKEANYNLTTCG